MKFLTITAMAVCLAGLLTGCGGGSEAVQVAEGFWGAMQDGDVEKAKSFATRESAEGLTINEDDRGDEGEVTFGEPTKHDDYIAVPTTVTAENDDGMPMTIDMETVVVKEDGEWKVDVNRTMMSMFGGAMQELMQGMTDAMGDAMEDMGKAMEEEMKKADDKKSNP